MKDSINKKELVLKQRRKWSINPATRISESGKGYNRSAEKQASQHEIEKEMHENREQNSPKKR